jgi:hypothetical protein
MTFTEPDGADSQLSPRPRLTAEWRLVITLADSGVICYIPVEGQEEAVRRGRRSGHMTWHIEKRYVGEWKATTQELRSAIVAVDKPKPRREVDPGVVISQDGQ